MFLEIDKSLGNLILIYPVQTLLLVILIALGIFELYHYFKIRTFFNIGRNFVHRKCFK